MNMKNLLISGDTNQLQEWDIKDIIPTSRKFDRDRMTDFSWGEKISKYGDGMTYLEIEQFNNTYNNWN